MTVDPRVLALIAARHGRSLGEVEPLPPGAANHCYRLGPDLVLRIPRADPAELRKEAAVIPVARAAGVRTPEVRSYDPDLPYLVLEHVPGAELAAPDPVVLTELGRQLARLHRLTPATAIPGVPTDTESDPRPLVDHLATTGLLDRTSAAWLTDWLNHLAPYRPASNPVLVHGDVHPQNLLTHNGSLTLIDWGDAAWADPATDFVKLPLDHLHPVLTGYLPTPADREAWTARILWHNLSWTLGRLRNPRPRPDERHWSAPPYARLLDLLRFLAQDPPEPWRSLLPNSRAGKH
ncbi:phosphotransferase family protein [Crossiella cryophila]|uniref:Aminoglycoside phosphotransferase (APT) family kinase protein n=1 Tax=Crossiella cryophila TaxID=43355 RepID=A0A7W7CEL7_9PSEU|nr:aminoglycoside phosphotransferase family protein [Crossiella cryophila]MBB4679765.1 aminoglycoside phosphotransferase (APT) family kinase protein [Crossiella cryophila]